MAVENIPVKNSGKIIGIAKYTSVGIDNVLQINFDFEVSDHIMQLFVLGLADGVELDFTYIPAVQKIVADSKDEPRAKKLTCTAADHPGYLCGPECVQ